MRRHLFAWYDDWRVRASGEMHDELGDLPPVADRHKNVVCRMQVAGGDGGHGGTGGGGGGVPQTTTAAGASSSAAGGGSAAAGGGNAYNKAPWLFPSSDFVNLDVGPNSQTGAVALPIIGDTATILTYTVPKGRYGRLTALGIDFVANGATGAALFTQGVLPPELTFSIQIDGRPVKSYEAFNYLPGAVSAPTAIAGIMLKENQVVTVLVTNNTVTVATQFIAARIQGYLFSKNLQAKQQGYQS